MKPAQAAQIVELNAAEGAVIKSAARDRLQHADGMFDQPVDFVRPVSPLEIFGPAAGALGMAAKIVKEPALRADARFTFPAFKYNGVNRPLPKSTTGSCQRFPALATLPHYLRSPYRRSHCEGRTTPSN